MLIRFRLQILQLLSHMIVIFNHAFFPATVFGLEEQIDSKSSYFLLKPSHVREGNANITTDVEDDFTCKQLCLRDPKCYTINFEKSPRKGTKFHMCQILQLDGIGEELPSQEFDNFTPMPREDVFLSCSHARSFGYTKSTYYIIDPSRSLGKTMPFRAYCNMTSHAGVTIIDHNSGNRTLVNGFNKKGSYRRDVVYDGISSLDQLRALTFISKHCEQFIKYECNNSMIFFRNGEPYSWLVSHDGRQLLYWGGASRDSKKCACGMTNSCVKKKACNCDANDRVWREDSGMLSYKEDLPIISLRFGDTGMAEMGYHTLGSLKCYGMADH